MIPPLNRDGSERVAYNRGEYPLYLRAAALSLYPDYRAISHWHDDVEFVVVFSGRMEYNVNGSIVPLAAGDGIFVNTRQLHYGFSARREECQFLCVLFHPMLLAANGNLEQQYIAPVLQNPAMPWLHLHRDIPAENEILEALHTLFAERDAPAFPLKAQQRLFQIWERLYALSNYKTGKNLAKDRRLTILRDMISYIERHYTEKLSLEQIAAAGAVGKTSCCAIFRTLTNETPIAYLNSYRLRMSVELMRTTDMSIAELCFAVGFSGASYFTEAFRKAYGRTPTEYRAALAAGIL